MIWAPLVFLLTASPHAAAQIFKWIDADGHTQFSDRPQTDADLIGLDKTTPETVVNPLPAGGEAETTPILGPYIGFEIVSPAPNETLRQTQDTLAVRLLLDPPLIGGHQLEFVLDGSAMRVEKSAATQLVLTAVAFGSHQAYAQILNSRGIVVARTPSATFHLRKPTPPGVLP